MKLKRIAVVIRGHRRTWEYTKQHMFDFFEQVSDHVDYYVQIWYSNSSLSNVSNIPKDFENKNLKHFEICHDSTIYDAFLGPPYLSNKTTKTRFEQERLNGRYDAVIDTRPDVIFKLIGTPTAPDPWTVGSTRVLPRGDRWAGLEDHVFIMDSGTHLVWNQRINYTSVSEDGHQKLLTWAEMHNLKPYQVNWFLSKIVRPNVYQFNHSKNYHDQIHNIERQWQNASPEEKFKILTEAGVNGDEYLTYLRMSN
jgi:hypothetical protein